MKYCPRCERHLPADGFYRDVNRPDGLASRCSECTLELQRIRRNNNPIWNGPTIFVHLPWMNNRNCAGLDPDLFFPERGGDSETPKAVCQGCTVRADCLDYALDNNERYGIWGGTSERQRRQIRQENAA